GRDDAVCVRPQLSHPATLVRRTAAGNPALALALADELAAVALWRRLLVRVGCDLESAVQREFFQDVVYVALHRVGRDVEPLCDLLLAEPRGDEIGAMLLAFGHSHRGRDRRVAQCGG